MEMQRKNEDMNLETLILIATVISLGHARILSEEENTLSSSPVGE